MDYSTGYTIAGLGWPEAPKGLFCAGTYGCHGNRHEQSQSMATQGSHHADDSMLKFGSTFNSSLQGGTSGTSYRFISGVHGGEDSDWEYTVAHDDHNEYMGGVLANRTSQTDDGSINTMSEACAGCHGNFHMMGGAAGTGLTNNGLATPSPWIRHPSDVLIPDEAPYNLYNTYDYTAVVARDALPNSSFSPASAATGYGALVDNPGDPIVFCLSCHRAHASDQLDSLRFSYDDMTTGTSGGIAVGGCFACHSDK